MLFGKQEEHLKNLSAQQVKRSISRDFAFSFKTFKSTDMAMTQGVDLNLKSALPSPLL